MSIIFEPFDVVNGTSQGVVRLRLGAAGIDALTTAGSSFGAVALDLSVYGDDEGSGGTVAIIVPDYGNASMFLSVGATLDGAGYTDEGEGRPLALRQLGYDFNTDVGQSAGTATLTLGASGLETPQLTAYIFLVERPGEMMGLGGVAYEAFESGFSALDAQTFDITMVFESIARFVDRSSAIGRLDMLLQSSFAARDVFTFVVEAAFESAAVFADDAPMLMRAVLATADQITLADQTIFGVDALLVAASAFVIRDALRVGVDLRHESAFEITDDLASQLQAVLTQASALVMADELTATLSASAFFEDSAAFGDGQGWSLAALLQFTDDALFSVRFALPGNDQSLYVGYAMNLRTAGMATYDNYPFSAMAVVGGVPLAVGPEGLYRLTGDTDAGDPIRAHIRTGMTDFGTAMLKRTPNMYLGLKTDGTMLLKVITSEGGRKKANVYKVSDARSATPVDGRFDIAKGLVGLYWGYQIENADGADFELDTIRVWPFAVQRRKSGR